MRVLVAPDKFKGTLTAEQAARAISAGWRRSRPHDDLIEIPMADGGEGTLDALVAALGGEVRTAAVAGPLGMPVDAAFGLVDAGASDGTLGVVEMARASGLLLVPEGRRDPLRSSTRGTGELIAAACDAGASRVLVGIGGSASTDGGAGMAQGVGVRLLDARELEIAPGGSGLLELERIDLTTLTPSVARASVIVASDVDNPLTGPRGAAAVFGPQKGATPDDVLLLDRALGHLAAVAERDLGLDLRSVPGGGAAGGLGAGLVAFLGATIRPGVEVVMDAVGLRERLPEADLVLTGEGSFDRQSLGGKVPAGILGAAAEAGVSALVLCGRADVAPEGVRVRSLVERFGQRRALEEPRRALEDLAAEVAAELPSAP